MTLPVIVIPAGLIIFFLGLYVGKKHGIPFLKKERAYSIGIYSGVSPFNLTAHPRAVNPVLEADDVTDAHAEFVADPFMVKEKDVWYMFFEVMNRDTGKGDIGLAESSDGLQWTYKRIVLEEPFHLSYPHVFKWRNDYYMVPESCQAYAVRLYKAEKFPEKWVFVKTLLKGNYFDSSLFHHQNRWWMFTSDRNDILRLFSAEDLTADWEEHPDSPVVFRNGHFAREGGRIVKFNDRILRFTQDCEPEYGMQVHAFEITELTPGCYHEREITENPILKPTGSGWNGENMHHIDLHELRSNEWLACVDGVGGSWKLTI